MIAPGSSRRSWSSAASFANTMVKTTSRGSKVVTDYLDKAGLHRTIDALGFILSSMGAPRAIGNSGPLPDDVRRLSPTESCGLFGAERQQKFRGAIQSQVRANYLTSPPLVVAYTRSPAALRSILQPRRIGKDGEGKDVYLREIWPSEREIQPRDARRRKVGDVSEPRRERVRRRRAAGGRCLFQPAISSSGSTVDYVRKPPFVEGISKEPKPSPTSGRTRTSRCSATAHDRPYLAGRIDSRRQPGRSILIAQGVKTPTSTLRRAPRQS